MNAIHKKATGLALLAACLYALNVPVSKLLLAEVPSTMMAALLYLGAGIGLGGLRLLRRPGNSQPREAPLTRRDLPYVIGMVVLDIAAPISLMVGLTMTTPANAALLNNFEIVATSLIALLLFRERISRRLWIAILLVTLSSMLLTVQEAGSLSFSAGSMLVLLACVFWGFENNCTRVISVRDPQQIVIIKGFGSGLGSLLIAFAVGESLPEIHLILCVLLLGFVAYGLSILCYIYAQRTLGAARTSACYAIAPFVSSTLSLIIFRQLPDALFLLAFLVMAAGTWLASSDGAA